MNWNKKIISFVIFLGILAGSFSVPIPVKGIITNLMNTPTPNQAGSNATQRVRFLNSVAVPIGGRIEITFPAAFNMTSGGDWLIGDITLNLQNPACTVTDVLLDGQKLSFGLGTATSGVGFQEITLAAKVINPPTPGNYTISLTTYDTAANSRRIIENATSSQFEIVNNMTKAVVIPEPILAGTNAKYTIRFKTGSGSNRSLYTGDRVKIDFDTNLPSPANATLVPGTITKDCVRINGMHPTVDPIVDFTGTPGVSRGVVQIVAPQNISSTSSSGADITIEFDLCAGIINPSALPWDRRVTITTLRSNGSSIIEGPLDSNMYQIKTSLSSPKVMVRPDQIGQTAEYHAILSIGNNGELIANSGRIDVIFPEGTIVPPSIPSTSIKIASSLVEPAFPCVGVSSPAFDPHVVGNKISFVTPINAPNNSFLCISFSTLAGIVNPTIPGNYYLKFSTSAEPTLVTSSPYFIKSPGKSSVVVTPHKSREQAEYKISFNVGVNGSLYPFGTPGTDKYISIIFPIGFTIPFTIPAGAIKVNGISTSDPAIITGQKITFPTPVVIENNTTVELILLKQANVRNPDIAETPQFYNLIIETDKEKDANRIISDSFAIETWITDLNVLITDPGTNVVSRYEVNFTTGDVDTGLLPADGDTVTIEFPAGTTVPPFISTGNIRFTNDVGPSPSSVLVMGQKVTLTLPLGFPIPQVTPVKVIFFTSCGILNPSVPGAYRLIAFTSKEPTPVFSSLYTIGSVSGAVQISVEPNVSTYCSSLEGAVYTVKFITGSSGGLANGQNVFVIFPPEYTPGYLSAIIPAGRITVNGILTMLNAVVDAAPVPQFPVGSRRVTIPLPISISNQSVLEIKFLASANVDNPIVSITPQPFYLSVYTDSEPSPSNGIFYLVSAISGLAAGCNIPVGVSLTNQSAGSGTGMNIQFRTGPVGSMNASTDKVNITFPVGTKIPSFVSGAYITMNVGVDNFATSIGVLNPKIVNQTITFDVPFGLPPITSGTAVYVYVTQGAGIVNPSTPGNYHLIVSTTKEPTEVKSVEYMINYVGTTRPSITVIPNFVAAEASYAIKFYTGSFGQINVGDPINFVFPLGTTIPDPILNPILPQNVTVNGVPTTITLSVDTLTRQITIYSSTMIAGNASVNVVFNTEAHIRNPIAANGQYTIQVWTLREGSPANPFVSNYYEIITANRPTVSKVFMEPCTPFTNSKFVFTFYTPVNLTADVDSIEITFPTGTFIPSTMNANTVLFGTQQCRTSPVINLYTVKVFPPAGYGANGSVQITFTKDSGLQNPAAGNYHTTVRVVAPGAGGSTDSESFFVCPDLDFGRLEIVPAGTRIATGKSQMFTARVFDTDGAKMDFGVTYLWSVSDNNLGILDNARIQNPEFYARNMGSGSVSVVASYGSKTISASVNIVVLGPLVKVVLTPKAITTSRGKKTTLIAQGFDLNEEILENITFDWVINPPLGKINKQAKAGEIEFIAESEGECTIEVTASQTGIALKDIATVIIKNGINSLKFNPDTKPEAAPSELIGPFSVQLLNQAGAPHTTKNDIVVQLISSSTKTKFSIDSVNWSKSNFMYVDVSQNFTETLPFYIAEPEANNITIIASSSDYNSSVLSLSIRGSKKSLQTITPPQNVRVNKPSEMIKVQFIDILGKPYSVKNDTLLFLDSSSETGVFSRTVEPWTPVEQITVAKDSSTIEFYYRDVREGSFTLTFMNPLFGTSSQLISISSPGSVSSPEVIVNPSINSVQAEYSIKFSLGIDGELKAGRDTITVQFPAGTVIPSALSDRDVSVNGTTLLHAPTIDVMKFKLVLEVPSNLNPGESVELVIRNITNPSQIGQYNLQISTSAQPTPAVSQTYRIDVSSISSLLVTPKPIIVSAPAEYQIQFKTGLKGDLTRDDTIFVLFDYGNTVPKAIKKENVMLNGMQLAKDPSVDGKVVTIAMPRDLPANSEITILFKLDCDIKNPPLAGIYKLKVYTIKEQVLVESLPFEIVQNSIIRNLKISAVPATVSSSGEYTVEFSNGPYGSLSSSDFIYLTLTDLILPKVINSTTISVNNIRLTQNVTITDKTIKIPVPSFIPENSKIVIVLYRSAGIINPSKPGADYRISAFTSQETLPVVSDPYTIEPTILISYVITPSDPNGLNGYYTVEPRVIFTTNVLGRIYYRIDNSQEMEYLEPIALSANGQHEVFYRCISSLGSQSAIASFTYKLDNSGPEIETNIKEEVFYTKNDSFALSVIVRDVTKVLLSMNNQEIELIENTYSTLLKLKEGENLILLRASDEAGNMTTLIRKVILKKNPPVLLVTSPALFQIVENIYFANTSSGAELFANVRFAGSVELGVESIKIYSQTTGYTIEIQVDYLGAFDKTVGIRGIAGDNVLVISAIDKVGNETKVMVSFNLKSVLKLRIGNATAYLNGNPVQLEVKPYLKYNQYTMVPFRLIAESLGAKITWEEATRKVSYDFRGYHVELSIGSKKAVVTDPTGKTKNVTLQAEPELMSGRTQIPLRFVAEALNAKVGWDGKLWEATVSYP